MVSDFLIFLRQSTRCKRTPQSAKTFCGEKHIQILALLTNTVLQQKFIQRWDWQLSNMSGGWYRDHQSDVSNNYNHDIYMKDTLGVSVTASSRLLATVKPSFVHISVAEPYWWRIGNNFGSHSFFVSSLQKTWTTVVIKTSGGIIAKKIKKSLDTTLEDVSSTCVDLCF